MKSARKIDVADRRANQIIAGDRRQGDRVAVYGNRDWLGRTGTADGYLYHRTALTAEQITDAIRSPFRSVFPVDRNYVIAVAQPGSKGRCVLECLEYIRPAI